MPAAELCVVSTVNTELPDPSWTVSAVEEAKFISRAPLPVKPEIKGLVELVIWKRLAEATEAALILKPRVEAEAWLTVKVLLTPSVELKVLDALTKIPAEGLVGVRALVKRECQEPGDPPL